MIFEDHTEEKGDHSREEQREKQLIKDQNLGGAGGRMVRMTLP